MNKINETSDADFGSTKVYIVHNLRLASLLHIFLRSYVVFLRTCV